MGTPFALIRHMDHRTLHHDEFDDLISHPARPCEREERSPSPGIAAVLSVLIPGLGQVYNGRLVAGACWFLAASFAYWAILVPGFIVHALCVWLAYRGARDWQGY